MARVSSRRLATTAVTSGDMVLDVLVDVALVEELSLAHLEDLRGTLRKRGLAEKTIRNVIDGSFRAMMWMPNRMDILQAVPAYKVRWPEKIVPGPSPFTMEERDQILSYFKAKTVEGRRTPTPGRTIPITLFSTSPPFLHRHAPLGSRRRAGWQSQSDRPNAPGGAVASSWRGSSTEDAARPSSGAADSEQRGGAGVARRAEGAAGRLSVQERLGSANRCRKLLRPVPQATPCAWRLSISPLRDLDLAKDTYISLALTNGVSPTWLSEQTGVAITTIMKHYGRFIHSSQADDIEMSKIEAKTVQVGHRDGHRKRS